MGSIKFLSLIALSAIVLVTVVFCGKSKDEGTKMNKSIYDFKVKTIDGAEKSLSDYKGKVLLIVNVASYCGYTKQYTGLQELYKKYQSKGFEILAFPCNQFGAQEPGTAEEIKNFCDSKYSVTFQLFEKIDVNGANAHPLYTFLTKEQPGFITDDIKWNFTKFLVDKNGKVVDRFATNTTPESIDSTIAKLL